MAKIKLTGESSGYVEISAPSAAGNNTLELPASGTKIVVSDGSDNINVNAINVTGGSVGIGTDNPQKLIEVGAANTTSKFQLSPHGGGWDIGATIGNIAPHYQTDLSLYNGQIGSGTLRWQIDSNGYMSVPFQPAFRATREGSGSVITSAQRLPFNSTSANGGFDNTNSYNTSNYTYTAPVAGVYFFTVSTYTNINLDSMYDIRVNGLVRQRIELRQSNGDDIGENTIIHGNCIVKLAQGDVVDAYWASDTVELIQGSGFIQFSGAKIS